MSLFAKLVFIKCYKITLNFSQETYIFMQCDLEVKLQKHWIIQQCDLDYDLH